MSFYSEFSHYYEQVFPFQSGTFSFLQNYVTAEGAKILDVGCGTGHYTGRFADIGIEAYGIDLDRQMIEYAKKHYDKGVFLPVNMLEINQLNQPFGLVFSIGNVVSHLPVSQLVQFIDRVYNSLSDRGYWIFQVVNWDFILKEQTYAFPDKKIEDGTLTFTRKYREISALSVIFQTALKSEKETIFSEETVLYPVKAEDYISIHEKAGFELAGHYSDYNGTPYASDLNKGNIIVFRK